VDYGEYFCIDTTNINQGEILYNRLRRVSEESFRERILRLKPAAGDVLFSREGSIGLSVIVPDNMEVCLGQRMMLFRTHYHITPEYFRIALISSMFVAQWEASLKGTAARHVNVGALSEMIIPIPPLAEQHRIVAKVDELFALADEAAGRGGAAEGARERFLVAITN
jgi:type I restriction enzyme S subunit